MFIENYKTVGIVNENKKIVKDEMGKLYYLKTLENYHLSVFAWLQMHPDIHIPKIIQFEEKNEKLIVLEEYIDGITLEQLLVHEISMHERKDILNQIFDGISYLHHADPSIIHRDIKPSNIMIDQNRIVKIIDYDAAKLYVKNQSRDTVLLGTDGIAAPEQYGFGASDTRTDIYALGMLIKEMFSDDINMLEVSNRCTNMNPDDRYQSIEELKRAASIQTKKKSYMNIPGFRNDKKWHKIVASIGYFFIVLISFSSEVLVGDHVVTNLVYCFLARLTILFMVLGWVDVFTEWTGIFNHFPWIHDKNIIKRILGYSFACCCVLFMAAIMQGVFQALLGVS